MRRFRLKYTGGILTLAVVTLMTLTVFLLPAALVILLEEIEIVEAPSL